MKTKNLIQLMAYIIIVLASISSISCEKDEGANDPEGTIELDMRKKGEGGNWLYAGNISFRISAADNFQGAYFIDVGPVNGLASIKSIPKNSTWAEEVAVRPGHGYIIADGNDFMRLYVVRHLIGAESGGIIGAAIKYQYPWNPQYN